MTEKKFITHYEKLKVSRDATDEEIIKSYNEILKKYNPEIETDEEKKKKYIKINQIVKISFDTLIDPVKRREHDDLISFIENENVNQKIDTNTKNETTDVIKNETTKYFKNIDIQNGKDTISKIVKKYIFNGSKVFIFLIILFTIFSWIPLDATQKSIESSLRYQAGISDEQGGFSGRERDNYKTLNVLKYSLKKDKTSGCVYLDSNGTKYVHSIFNLGKDGWVAMGRFNTYSNYEECLNNMN
jgi:curved DNA-binding protein CbpA